MRRSVYTSIPRPLSSVVGTNHVGKRKRSINKRVGKRKRSMPFVQIYLLSIAGPFVQPTTIDGFRLYLLLLMAPSQSMDCYALPY